MGAFFALVPAYGRDYKSAKAVKADWEAGKDFQINMFMSPEDGRYINKEDAPKGARLTVRYNRNTQIMVIKT